MDHEFVSVIMLSYRHSAYISKALDSVLSQKTNFKYIIVIGDDASSDNTQEIIQTYIDRYPDYFRAYLRKKNLGMNQNFIDLINHCKGKYLAFLECDDYWCDEDKLQKQVDFLEHHPDYSAVTAQCMRITNTGAICESKMKNYCQKAEYTIRMLDQYKLPGHMSTWLMRNIFPMNSFPLEHMLDYKNCTGDRLFPILLLSSGRIRCMQDIVSAYRFDCSKNASSWSASHLNLIAQGNITDFKRLTELETIASQLAMNLHFMRKKRQYYTLALYYSMIHHNDACKQALKTLRARIHPTPIFLIHSYLSFLLLCLNSVKKRLLTLFHCRPHN